jgi:hypothetical protein
MKRFSAICFFFLASLTLHAQQDSAKAKPVRALTLHFSNGINLLRSPQLQSAYGTKSMYYWGVGIRTGNPDKDLVLFAIDYTRSSYTLSGEVNNRSVDSLLQLIQIIPRLSCKMIGGKELALRAHMGYIYTVVTDKVNRLDDYHCGGFKIGLSMERKVFRSQAVHFDLDYDRMKPGGNRFRDYDVVKLSVGFYL